MGARGLSLRVPAAANCLSPQHPRLKGLLAKLRVHAPAERRAHESKRGESGSKAEREREREKEVQCGCSAEVAVVLVWCGVIGVRSDGGGKPRSAVGVCSAHTTTAPVGSTRACRAMCADGASNGRTRTRLHTRLRTRHTYPQFAKARRISIVAPSAPPPSFP